jgi:hypothetical protein
MENLMNHPCPRFDKCNAALCPLTMEGSHRRGEAMCKYLRDAAKGAPLPPTVAPVILSNYDRVAREYPDIALRLARAANSPAQGANVVRQPDAAQERDSANDPNGATDPQQLAA